MSNLEDLIRDIVARGELTHLSVSPMPTGKGFTASYAPAGVFGVTIKTHDDPVAALRLAITSTKLKGRRTVSAKPAAEPDAPTDDMDFG